MFVMVVIEIVWFLGYFDIFMVIFYKVVVVLCLFFVLICLFLILFLGWFCFKIILFLELRGKLFLFDLFI